MTEFAARLRKQRAAAKNPTYRDMSLTAHYSPAALSQAAAGRRLPTWDCAKAYLRACGVVDEFDIRQWAQTWEQTNRTIREPALQLIDGSAEAVLRPEESMSTMPANVLITHVLDLAEFRLALTHLRVERGLTLRQLAEESRRRPPHGGVRLTRTGISEMLSGKAPLRVDAVGAYMATCGMPEEQIAEWSRALRRLIWQHRRAAKALRILSGHAEISETQVEFHDTPAPSHGVPVITDTFMDGAPGRYPLQRRGTHRRRASLLFSAIRSLRWPRFDRGGS